MSSTFLAGNRSKTLTSAEGIVSAQQRVTIIIDIFSHLHDSRRGLTRAITSGQACDVS